MKLKYLIVSAIILAIVAVTGILLYSYWPAITGTIKNSKYYTSEELQESYDKGFNDGCNNFDELTGQVDYYKELTDVYYLEILDLKRTITSLENNNKENIKTISNLQQQVKNLESINVELQKNYDLNIDTIASLNNQIVNLNNQINEMNTQISSNSNVVNALNNRIIELEKSVSYYEQYIASLENSEQVVATFEFNGSVYNIQIVNKNDCVSVVNPTSTDYIKFNYWTVNDQQVDLTNYTLTTNTTFVANITKYYDVKFMVNSELFNSQIVEKDNFAVLPESPTKDGYIFDGWTINGVDIVDITSIAISQNTIFTAKFTKLYNVTFIYEDSTLEIQQVKNDQCANAVEVEDTTYKKFNGWLLNGTLIDLNNYKVTSNIVLNASITYFHDVTFMVDGNIFATQIVEKNMFVVLSETPTKDSYEFKGWSLNGDDVIDLAAYSITKNEIFIAVFSRLSGLYEVEFNNLSTFNGMNVWTDGTNTYYINGSTQYVLDKETNTWIAESNFDYSLGGCNVWTDGINFYCSNGYESASADYKFNTATKTWEPVTFSISIDDIGIYNGARIWTDGSNVYFNASYRNQYYETTYYSYVFDKNTNSWKVKSWNINISDGKSIWTDGFNIYYSDNSNNYILDKSTNTWKTQTWNVTIKSGYYIWTDGANTYYSYNKVHYVLDKETNTWIEQSWNIVNFDGRDVWTDGENYYYSYKGANYIIYI